MNKKTLATAVASVIAFILLCVNTLAGTNIQLDEETLTAISTLVAAGIMWAIGNYYNQDYSGAARKMTPIMRKIKKLEKAGDLRLLDRIEAVIEEWEAEENDD